MDLKLCFVGSSQAPLRRESAKHLYNLAHFHFLMRREAFYKGGFTFVVIHLVFVVNGY